MHLVAAPQLPAPTLDVPTFVGATWRLSAVIDAKGVPQMVPREVTLRIADGTMTASDGCNTLTGAVQVTGQDARLKGVSSTPRSAAPVRRRPRPGSSTGSSPGPACTGTWPAAR